MVKESRLLRPTPGPGRWTTMRRLFPVPFRRFPEFLREMTDRYGHVIAFALPWRSYIFVNEPAVIKDVFVTQKHAFSKSLGIRVLRLLLGDGLLTSEDPLHRQMRRIVQPAFHRERVAQYVRVMERDALEFVDGLQPGVVFDVHGAMIALTLRIATETLFGTDESASAQAVGEALRLMMLEFPYMLTPLSSLRQRLALPATKRFERSRAMLDGIIYDLIERRHRDATERADALSLLLAARDGETGFRPHDEQIRDEIMTLFTAGHETTANALTWALYLLAHNPDIDARAADAVARGDFGPIERIVKETLRLYPPAWIIGRESREDVTLVDGTFVPAGTTVFVAPLLLHRRREYFAEPDRFDPDRWLDDEPPQFAFIPFGGGARRCIGEDFALREASIVLAKILQHYRLSLATTSKIDVDPLVTLRPAGPVPMKAIARTPAI